MPSNIYLVPTVFQDLGTWWWTEQAEDSACPYGCHWLLMTVIAIDYKLRKSIPSFKWMWLFEALWSRNMLRHILVSKIILFQSASFASFLLEFPIPPYAQGTISSAEGSSTASSQFKRIIIWRVCHRNLTLQSFLKMFARCWEMCQPYACSCLTRLSLCNLRALAVALELCSEKSFCNSELPAGISVWIFRLQ